MAELKGAGHRAEMAPGAKSQFDVVADGVLVFSKEREGRYPELADVVAAVIAAGG